MTHVFRALPFVAVSIFAVGCQNTPTNSSTETQSTSVQTKNPLAGTPPTGGLMESSYQCQNAQGEEQIISVFYDSRQQATAPATLRINEVDYPMSVLSQNTESTAYITQQQVQNGHWLIWQTATAQPNIAQLSINSNAGLQGAHPLYGCQKTR